MPDTLDVLRRLAETPPVEPPDVPALRRRIARRRRRRATVAVAALALLGGVAVVSWPGDEPDRDHVVTEPAPDPDPTATTATTGTTATVPASSGLPAGTAISGVDGVFVVGADGVPTRRWDRPAAEAFGLEDVIVAQEGPTWLGDYILPGDVIGPIVVIESTHVRALPIVGAERLQLLDVGTVDGRAVALAGSATGGNPDNSDVRLLLVDLETGDRRDLGSAGGYEAPVTAARLLSDGVLLVRQESTSWFVDVRTFDGTTLWTSPGSDEARPALAVSATRASLVAALYGDGRPRLAVTAVDLARGPGDPGVVDLEPIDATISCTAAEWLGERVLCSGSGAQPATIDPVSGEVEPVTGVVPGVVRLPRFLSTSPTPCAAEQQAVADVDGDGDVDTVYNRWDALRLVSVLGVCLASGDVRELEVGVENLSTIDVEPDGRAEILHNRLTDISSDNGLAVVLDGALREVVGDDGEPFRFDAGVFPGEGRDVPGVGLVGCDDVDGDGRRELIVAEASVIDGETRWTRLAYALDAATAHQVADDSGTDRPLTADEVRPYVQSLAPPC